MIRLIINSAIFKFDHHLRILKQKLKSCYIGNRTNRASDKKDL